MGISAWLQLVSTLMAVVGITFVAYQIKLTRDQIQREAARIRKQSTLEYARQTLDTRHKNWPELPDDWNAAEVKRFINECVTDQSGTALESALGYLGLLETLCIGIDQGIYDKNTVNELYGSRMAIVAQNYKPLIDWRRNETHDDDFFITLTRLANQFS
jgi:type II secretory pathway pseudopilin PulG